MIEVEINNDSMNTNEFEYPYLRLYCEMHIRDQN